MAGEAASGDKYIPNVYQKPTGTLTLSASKTLCENWKLSIGAKNLLRPAATQYYQDGGTRLFRTHYTTPIEYSFGLEGKW